MQSLKNLSALKRKLVLNFQLVRFQSTWNQNDRSMYFMSKIDPAEPVTKIFFRNLKKNAKLF